MASASDQPAPPNYLELLTEVARRHGWALNLGCEIDGYGVTRLARLVLVQPAGTGFEHLTRRQRVRAGSPVARAELADGDTVQDGAQAILAGLIAENVLEARQ